MRALFALVALASCAGPPCKSQSECPLGSYCVLDVGGGGAPSGECVSDCFVHSDCPQPNDNISRAICSNQGQCRSEPIPPRLIVTEPEPDSLFEEGTRTVRITGEVESAAENVSISAFSVGGGNCIGGAPRIVHVSNDNEGQFTRLPFVIDGVFVDSGFTTINVVASVMGSERTDVIPIEVACPGCAAIAVDEPNQNMPVANLLLPRLAGSISPGVPSAVWRVHSSFGDVFDGALPVVNGVFVLERVPIFAGANRIEVVVSGVGEGLGESRCSVPINSSVGRERGLRLVLGWDGPTSDLDLHLIGPNGSFGDPLSSLSVRSPSPSFGGEIMDDFDGFGPEIGRLETLADGVYGVIVEPVFDADDPGASAILRALGDGRSLTPGPIGPRHVSSDAGDLWVAGTIAISAGNFEWRPIDEVLSASTPPTAPPSEWPSFFTPD
jgi:hypothetical protein